MTDENEKLRQGSPAESTQHLQRYLLLGRLAELLQRMVDHKIADPDTETYEIITNVEGVSKKEEEIPPSRLEPDNLKPVLEAMKRRDTRSR